MNSSLVGGLESTFLPFEFLHPTNNPKDNALGVIEVGACDNGLDKGFTSLDLSRESPEVNIHLNLRQPSPSRTIFHGSDDLSLM